MTSFRVIDCAQGTPEWLKARAGRLCASDAAAMLSTIKSGEAAARRDLRTKIVLERLTGGPLEDGFVSPDMQRGKDLEADAVAAYEGATGNLVQRVGFFAHPTLPLGYSPDGVIGSLEGEFTLLECKVPRSATHLRNLRDGVVPSDYLPQLTHALYLTGAKAIDFCSFDPRFPEPLRLFLVRVKREDVDIDGYAKKVAAFLSEIEAEYNAINTLANLPAQLEASLAAG